MCFFFVSKGSTIVPILTAYDTEEELEQEIIQTCGDTCTAVIAKGKGLYLWGLGLKATMDACELIDMAIGVKLVKDTHQL